MKLHSILLLLVPVSAIATSADLASSAAPSRQTQLQPVIPRDSSIANDEVIEVSKSGLVAESKGTPDAPGGRKDEKHASSDGGEHKSQGKTVGVTGKSDATASSSMKEESGKNEHSMGAGATGEKVPTGPKEATLSSGEKGTGKAYKEESPSKHDPYAGAALNGPSSTNPVGSGEPEDHVHSLVFSFTMIVVSEIGDKTFLVAALMAMRHPRLLVFSAAFSALIAMTVLSAVLGHGIPTLIPKTFTKFMAALLFFIFGLKMLKEGREMSPDEGVGEEMREVEQELEEKEQEQLRMGRRRSSVVTPHALESGRLGSRRQSRGSKNRMPSPPESLSSSSSRESSPSPGRRWNDALVGMNNLFSLLLSPAWVQTFAMTFLGEWGDRSQIATIAMAAGQDYWWVTIGAASGHGICTAAAVLGGSAIAGKVSMRVVTLGGATAFLVFGVIYLIEAFTEL